MSRQLVLDHIVQTVSAVKQAHPLRVAVDGIDASGKTTLANELVEPLEKQGRHVIRASIDGFHYPRRIRYRRGPDSPEGYFFDSFDHSAVIDSLLNPLGPGGTLQYRTAVFDFRTDSLALLPKKEAPPNAILIFDGVFLLRPELLNFWDLKIFLKVDFDVAIARAARRDQSLFGSTKAVRERYRQRYVPGQRIYMKRCRPEEHADIIIDNNDVVKPRII